MRPAPLSINDLRAKGMTFAEAKQAHEWCGKYSMTLRSNVIFECCKSCAKGFQKCSTGPHSSHRDKNWQCPTCRAKQINRREPPSHDPNHFVSQSLPRTAH